MQCAVDGIAVVLQDVRLEQKYGITRGCRRKSSLAASHKGKQTHCMKQQQQALAARPCNSDDVLICRIQQQFPS